MKCKFNSKYEDSCQETKIKNEGSFIVERIDLVDGKCDKNDKGTVKFKFVVNQISWKSKIKEFSKLNIPSNIFISDSTNSLLLQNNPFDLALLKY